MKDSWVKWKTNFLMKDLIIFITLPKDLGQLWKHHQTHKFTLLEKKQYKICTFLKDYAMGPILKDWRFCFTKNI